MEHSLAEFIKDAWHVLEPGNPLIWNWHIDVICGYLEAVDCGEIVRIIFNIPPGTLKSLIVNVFYPAWVWTKTPGHKFLCGSNEAKLATRDSLKMRTLVQSQWYRGYWGVTIDHVENEYVDHVIVGRDQSEKTLFANTKLGHRESQGVLARVTGKRGDCVVGGTLVATEVGDVRIDALCAMADPPKVWSMDHGTGVVELKRIVNSRVLKKSIRPVTVRVLTGDLVTCTPDHQIWTDDGYISAESISGAQVSLLRWSDRKLEREKRSLPRLRLCCAGLLDLWQVDSSGGGSSRQAETVWAERWSFLQSAMRRSFVIQTTSYSQTMRRLWRRFPSRVNQSKPTVLFSILRRFFAAATQISRQAMRAVRRAYENQTFSVSILQREMCRAGSLHQDVRQGQLSFHASYEPRRFVQDDEASNTSTRQKAVRCVQQRIGWASIVDPSHRREPVEQHAREPSDAVRRMPYTLPQVIKSTASVEGCSIEPDSDGKYTVYDIEVEGNHNFFAGSISLKNSVIWDDPHDAIQTESDVQREAVTNGWDTGWATRVNNLAKSARILIMQRLHLKDQTAHLLDKKNQQWKLVVIPMRYDPDLTYDAGADLGRPELNDPRTVEGELMFPELFPEDAVQQLESDLKPYGTAGQLQQRPSPKGGGEFRIEWLNHWRMQPKGGNRYILVDPAGEKSRSNVRQKRDNTSMGVFEYCADGNIYLIDGVRDRLNLTERTALLFDWHRKYNDISRGGSKVLRVGYETYGMQSDIAHITDIMEREGYRFSIQPLMNIYVGRDGKKLSTALSKEDRIRRLIPLFENGKLWLPSTMFKTIWDGSTVDLIEQFVQKEYLPFPVAEWDDFFDMMSRIEDPDFKMVMPKQRKVPLVKKRVMTDRSVGYLWLVSASSFMLRILENASI